MYPDLAALDDPFSKHEVLTAIKQLLYDKAPGPDGFMGCFFKECWNLIKHDLLAVINYFHMGRCNRTAQWASGPRGTVAMLL